MQKPVYVTDHISEDFHYPLRRVSLPFEQQPNNPFDLEKYKEWDERNGWLIQYAVDEKNLEEAKTLAARLWELQKNPDKNEEEKVLNRLKGINAKRWKDRPEPEMWNFMAMQKPGDWGPASWTKKGELKRIATNYCFGRVLEPMCGFRTYIGKSDKIDDVVMLDFSIEALKRHECPERTRILYNLENVVRGDKMEFFEDGSFQTVAAFFGIDYLTNPVPVHKEFRRILSDNGQIIVVDGPGQGYMNIKKRKFNPEVCANHMQEAGFYTKIVPLPTVKLERELYGYYLVQGKKQEF